jgi:hypothetical protein
MFVLNVKIINNLKLTLRRMYICVILIFIFWIKYKLSFKFNNIYILLNNT